MSQPHGGDPQRWILILLAVASVGTMLLIGLNVLHGRRALVGGTVLPVEARDALADVPDFSLTDHLGRRGRARQPFGQGLGHRFRIYTLRRSLPAYDLADGPAAVSDPGPRRPRIRSG